MEYIPAQLNFHAKMDEEASMDKKKASLYLYNKYRTDSSVCDSIYRESLSKGLPHFCELAKENIRPDSLVRAGRDFLVLRPDGDFFQKLLQDTSRSKKLQDGYSYFPKWKEIFEYDGSHCTMEHCPTLELVYPLITCLKRFSLNRRCADGNYVYPTAIETLLWGAIFKARPTKIILFHVGEFPVGDLDLKNWRWISYDSLTPEELATIKKFLRFPLPDLSTLESEE
jgi:hypothetical protein